MPETTATFLAKHELSSYTAAFDEHGWDSLPALQDISDDDLKQLVTDVAMKSGHAARLRTALPSAAVAAVAAAAVAAVAIAAASSPRRRGAEPAAEPAAKPAVYPPSRPPPSPPPTRRQSRMQPSPPPNLPLATQTCRPPRPGSPTLEPAKF